MREVIDVHDLLDEDVAIVQELIEVLRKDRKNREKQPDQEIEFGAWPLGVKGNLSRNEIYEDR